MKLIALLINIILPCFYVQTSNALNLDALKKLIFSNHLSSSRNVLEDTNNDGYVEPIRGPNTLVEEEPLPMDELENEPPEFLDYLRTNKDGTDSLESQDTNEFNDNILGKAILESETDSVDPEALELFEVPPTKEEIAATERFVTTVTEEKIQNERRTADMVSRLNWNAPEWQSINTDSERLDLMFLLDGSGSVKYYQKKSGVNAWQKMKDFVKRTIQDFDTQTDNLRMGLVQYSHWFTKGNRKQSFVKTELPLGECSYKECFNISLNKIELMGYTTYTGAAIRKTVNEDFADSHPEATKVIVLLTDGKSTDDVYAAADYAKSKGVKFITVGIWKHNMTELQYIAGSPNNVVSLNKFEDLDTYKNGDILNKIRSMYTVPLCVPVVKPALGAVRCTDDNVVGSSCQFFCDDPRLLQGEESITCNPHPILGASWSSPSASCGNCRTEFDMLVVLDGSSSITKKHFTVMKTFVLRMIDTYQIGRDHVLMSVMKYNNKIYDLWDYDEYTEKNDLLRAVLNIGKEGKGTYTGQALDYINNHKFTKESGRRNNVPHITVLITDGNAQDDVRAPAAELHKKSKVIAIGVGNAIDEKEIMAIASDDAKAGSTVESFEELISIINDLQNTVCKVQRDVRISKCDEGIALKDITCGDLNCTNGYQAGSECQLSCCPNYQPLDLQDLPANIKCQYDGKWSAIPEWQCIEKTCPSLPTIPNSVINCTKNARFGSECRMDCKSGFDIQVTSTDNCKTLPAVPDFLGLGLGDLMNNPIIEFCENECIASPFGGDPTWKYGFGGFSCVPAAFKAPTLEDLCIDHKCQNEAGCIPGIGEYLCVCKPGYDGSFCELDIDDCIINPCQNEGTCLDLVDDILCTCKEGFEGRYCESNIDECAPKPCLNNAKCMDLENDYMCMCNQGFKGKRCELEDTPPCTKNPCVENQHVQCIDISNSDFECKCLDGYTGKTCDIDIDECASDPCQNGGQCTDLPSGYVCGCTEGYIGNHCEEQLTCEDISLLPGMIISCGVKEEPHTVGSVCQTTCQDGYRVEGGGDNCYADFVTGQLMCNHTCAQDDTKVNWRPFPVLCVDIDECIDEPCQNNGLCIDEVASYSCICPPGFEGRNCEGKIDHCAVSEDDDSGAKCLNLGDCVSGVNSFTCKCKPGFAGDRCQIDIDECQSEPCQNGAECLDLPDGYVCDCLVGFDGVNCEQELTCDDIIGMPGLVILCDDNTPHSFGKECQTTCANGYEPMDHVAAEENCKPIPNGSSICAHICTAVDKTEGVTIDWDTVPILCKDVDECATEPCLNGGQCVNLEGDFECKCLSGFTGTLCEIDIDDCENIECQNDGTCVDLIDNFNCACPEGFVGDLCEIDVDVCAMGNLCGDHGTCIDQKEGFNCKCDEGWQGALCDERISACTAEPCLNGAICYDTESGGYSCFCHNNFQGVNCEEEILEADECQVLNAPAMQVDVSPSVTEMQNALALKSLEVVEVELEEVVETPVLQTLNQHVMQCSDGNNIGSICELKCAEGYQVVGNDARTCQRNGLWSGDENICVKVRCSAPSSFNTDLEPTCTDGYQSGSYCMLNCPPRMVRFGHMYKMCTKDFNWTPDTAWGCTKTTCDRQPPATLNSFLSCTKGNRYGSVCKSICKPGYEMTKQGTYRCGFKGSMLAWVGAQGVCARKTCEKSIDLSTGAVTGFGLRDDYATLMRSPYRNQYDPNTNRLTDQPICNMKAIVQLNDLVAKDVTATLWYGKSPTQYHFDIGDGPYAHGLQPISYGQGVVLGELSTYSDYLMTYSTVGAKVQSGDETDIAAYRPGIYSQMFGPYEVANFEIANENIEFSNTKKVSGTFGPSPHFGTKDGRPVHLGLNRIPNPHWYYDERKVGSGLCYVCLNSKKASNGEKGAKIKSLQMTRA